MRQLEVTDEVLKEIDANEVPRIRVFNKIDHVGDTDAQAEHEAFLRTKYPDCIVMSARNPDDVATMRQKIVDFFQQDLIETEVLVPWSMQKLRGELYEKCQVLEERADNDGAIFKILSAPDILSNIRIQLGIELPKSKEPEW